ncbi:hypothetical protein ES705_17826 [subsurface metagenome]
MTSQGYALAREELIRALTAYSGITTFDGATDGTTLVDSNLIGRNDFITEKAILIMSGDAQYEDKGAASFNNANGTITLQGTGFSAQIVAGTIYRILNISSVEVDVEAIKVQTNKLAGETPVAGSANKTWNAGEADVVSIGADDTKYKLHSLVLSIHNLVGTTITVRMYMQVKGTERKVYEQTFDATADPPGLWIVNGTIGIHEVLRVTLQSNNAADDDKDVDYDYMLEAM